MSKNDSSSTRTKNIDIQYHFVRDSLAKKLFSLDFCLTQEMAADLLKTACPCTSNEAYVVPETWDFQDFIEHVIDGKC